MENKDNICYRSSNSKAQLQDISKKHPYKDLPQIVFFLKKKKIWEVSLSILKNLNFALGFHFVVYLFIVFET